jgi:hypothetical protein
MSNIKQAAAASVRSAVLFFGDPLGIVEQPISVEKFMRTFQTSCDVLGFDLHAQEMAVSYSLEKRAELRAKLADLHYTARGTTSAQIRDIASILGKMPHYFFPSPIIVDGHLTASDPQCHQILFGYI